MAAGLGFKDFTTGEVLTAADVDGYLMQGVWVFASATARDAAVTSPQEGNFAYLKDTNVTTYYTGSAWANLDTTGMTNPMTTTGDTIYSSSGSTPARLGIGSTGDVLTVAAGVPSWAAPAGGASGLSLVKRASFSSVANTGTTFDDVFTTTYKSYLVIIETINSGNNTDDLQIQGRYTGPNTQASLNYGFSKGYDAVGNANDSASNATAEITLASNVGGGGAPTMGQLFFHNVGNGSQKFGLVGQFANIGGALGYVVYGLNTDAQNTYMGFLLKSSSSNITGTVAVYGLATA
jgi:hypothetical protein